MQKVSETRVTEKREREGERRTPTTVCPMAWSKENAANIFPVSVSPRDCMTHRARLLTAGIRPEPKPLKVVAPTKRAWPE